MLRYPKLFFLDSLAIFPIQCISLLKQTWLVAAIIKLMYKICQGVDNPLVFLSCQVPLLVEHTLCAICSLLLVLQGGWFPLWRAPWGFSWDGDPTNDQLWINAKLQEFFNNYSVVGYYLSMVFLTTTIFVCKCISNDNTLGPVPSVDSPHKGPMMWKVFSCHLWAMNLVTLGLLQCVGSMKDISPLWVKSIVSTFEANACKIWRERSNTSAIKLLSFSNISLCLS